MYLITGANGQLGRCLSAILPPEKTILTDVAASQEEGRNVQALDITNEEAVKSLVTANNVDCIINCAAYTAVDKAEDEEDLALLINATGPKNLGLSGAKTVIHVSTDYVFDGNAFRPLTPEDKVNPVSAYGRTKLKGEEELLASAQGNVIIIRTSWLYSNFGNNFVKTMRRFGAERPSLNVVADQVGTPTLADDLADAIVAVIKGLEQNTVKRGNSASTLVSCSANNQASGNADNVVSAGNFIREIYHFSNEGVCSWYDFAVAIMQGSGLNCKIIPIPSSAYPTKTKRPFYSVLDKTKIKEQFGIEIPHWQESLNKCLSRF